MEAEAARIAKETEDLDTSASAAAAKPSTAGKGEKDEKVKNDG